MFELDKPREKCGVVGVYRERNPAGPVALEALYALQHRGEKSGGIVTYDGTDSYIRKGLGRLDYVFFGFQVDRLQGRYALGQTRYATDGKEEDHTQPVGGNYLDLSHNGNLYDTDPLKEFLQGVGFNAGKRNDSELMHLAFEYLLKNGASAPEAYFQLNHTLEV